jgi:hypothetical protein
VLGAGLSFLGTASSQSLLLQLRNGDRISGRLVAEEGGRLTVSNAILGKIVVPMAEIERRTTNVVTVAATVPATTNLTTNAVSKALTAPLEKRLDELQSVYMANQITPGEYHKQRAKLLAEARASTNAPPPPPTMANGVPAPALVNPAVTPKPPPGAPAPVRPAAPKHWSGEALLGADLGFGVKDRQLYSGRLKFAYARAPLKTVLDYLATYGRTDGELSANRMDASLKTDYDVNRQMYVYGLGGAGYDQVRKIDARYEAGSGVGKHLLRLTNFVLNAEIGLNYQVQNFEGNRQDDLFHYRLAQDLKWNIGTQFTLDEKIEYLPQWNNPKEYKFRAEGNLRYWVRANLSLNLTVIDTFDTLTAQGVQQNDLQVRSSIGVKF